MLLSISRLLLQHQQAIHLLLEVQPMLPALQVIPAAPVTFNLSDCTHNSIRYINLFYKIHKKRL